MLFSGVLISGLVYLFLNRRYETKFEYEDTSHREVEFANPYFPVESGAYDHAWRHVQGPAGGFSVGNQIGKLEYANPLPYVVQNEFTSKLNETSTGYAINGKSGLFESRGAVNIEGQRRLIESAFSLDEHPRLDLTRQDITKGRHRRSEWSFVPGSD